MTNVSTPCSPASSPTQPGAEDVVLDRLARIRLHQRHVLVGGGVEDDLRRVGREKRAHAALVADVRDQRHDLDLGARAAQLAVHLEQRELRAFDQEDPGGMEARDLPHELGADRAAGARHHDALARQELAELGFVEIHGLAAEKVFDLDVADARDVDPPLQHVVQAGDDANADLDLPAQADQVQDLLPGDLGDRDDDLGDPELLDQARQGLGRSEHPDALDHGALLVGVVVHEALDVEMHVAAAQDLPGREDAGPPRADEQRRNTLARVGMLLPRKTLGRLVEVASEHAKPEDSAEGEDAPHQDDGERDLPSAELSRERQTEHPEDQPRPERGVEERLDLAHPDVAPDEAVDAREGQSAELDEHDVRKLLVGVGELFLRDRELEAKHVRQRERADEDGHVQRELDAPRQARLNALHVHWADSHTLRPRGPIEEPLAAAVKEECRSPAEFPLLRPPWARSFIFPL